MSLCFNFCLSDGLHKGIPRNIHQIPITLDLGVTVSIMWIIDCVNDLSDSPHKGLTRNIHKIPITLNLGVTIPLMWLIGSLIGLRRALTAVLSRKGPLRRSKPKHKGLPRNIRQISIALNLAVTFSLMWLIGCVIGLRRGYRRPLKEDGLHKGLPKNIIRFPAPFAPVSPFHLHSS